MSSLKNVIQKNKKTHPGVKPSKFYKPPEQQKTDDVVLPDDVKIELSQDFEGHRAHGNAAERILDFDRMHPVHGMNKGLKHCCTWCWVPVFGWPEAAVRIAWHLSLFIIFTVLSLLTICKVLAIRRIAWNNLRLVKWYLGGLLCCYLPIPCCEADGWPWHYLEYYFSSFCCVGFCYGDSVRRTWELCFPLPDSEFDYPSECRTCCAVCEGIFSVCSVCCKIFKKCIPK